jgi:hypothetical protein
MANAQEETKALATRSNASTNLAVAEGYDRNDARGTEGIENDDVRLPFVAIAQKTSKAIDPTEVGKYIEGLKFLDMYNSETRDVYGPGPVRFIPIVLRKRAALLGENGRLGEPIPWDDPRGTWEGARDQGLDKPEGQRIYDWAVLLLPTFELVVLSFRSTSFGAGKSLNGFVKMRKPAFAGVYTISVAPDKNDKGSFGKFAVAPAGKPSQEQVEYAEQVYESLKGQNIVIADEAIESEAVEGVAQQAEAQTAPAVTKDNVPF